MTPQALESHYLNGDFRLKGEFSSCAEHSTLMSRCEKYAGWTLPHIFPTEFAEDVEIQYDYQSFGAQCVINLANKIVMALFQPARPFFRMNLTADQRKEVLSTGLSEAQVDEGLSEAERAAMRELDKIGGRVTANDLTQNLIITGNSLVHVPNNGKMKNYSVRDYTVLRDLAGDPIKIIVRETKELTGLSDELQALAKSKHVSDESKVQIFTGIMRVGKGQYIEWQEMEDIAYCHVRMGKYTEDTLPWIPLTWNLARGKNYGTGLVENYAGDFHTLSTLAEADLDYTTVVTDVKNLVDPTGMTDVSVIANAPSGAYVPGREGDVFVYTPNVGDASNFLSAKTERLERRVAAAFLLNSQVTRQAERVTAEEIRLQAHELEGSLGGVYSRLATELQLPLARRLMAKKGKIFNKIEPIIVTGLESLSRNSELDNIRMFFQDLLALTEIPPQVSQRIDYGNLIAMLGAGHGVEYKKFLKDEATVQKQQQATMEAQAQQAGAVAGAEAQAQGMAQPQG